MIRDPHGPYLVDTHAHLSMSGFGDDLDHVLFRARQAGINKILTVGIDILSSRSTIGIALGYPDLEAQFNTYQSSRVGMDTFTKWYT